MAFTRSQKLSLAAFAVLAALEAASAITVWPSMAEGGPGFPAPAFGHGAGPFGFSYYGKRQAGFADAPVVAAVHAAPQQPHQQQHNATNAGTMVTEMPMVVPTHVTPTPAPVHLEQPTQPTTPAPGDLIY